MFEFFLNPQLQILEVSLNQWGPKWPSDQTWSSKGFDILAHKMVYLYYNYYNYTITINTIYTINNTIIYALNRRSSKQRPQNNMSVSIIVIKEYIMIVLLYIWSFYAKRYCIWHLVH